MRQDSWDFLNEPLGRPDAPDALERARELVADGWEFLGVRFGPGIWSFRRPKRLDDDHISASES